VITSLSRPSLKFAINGDVVNAPTRSSAIATRSMVIAGMIMVFVGLFQFFQSVASIANGQLFIVRSDDTFRLDPVAWGWIRVILGIALAIVGFGVLSAATWARYAGMGLAGLQAFNSFFVIPHYPAWALTTIGLDILVIWALAARRSATTREHEPRVDSLAK
jgi:hypothetical protein